MYKYIISPLIIGLLWISCGSKLETPAPPDMRAYFSKHLQAADSTLILDSFRFIHWDTLHEKWTLIRQRFPYVKDLQKVTTSLDHILDRIQDGKYTLDPIQKDSIVFLDEEKEFLDFEIDSLNRLIQRADTVIPIGYMALFKITLHKGRGLAFTDTIHYSFNLKGQMIDWDRSNEKTIEALVAGQKAF